MGRKKFKPDTILKRFWRDNEHFADLFNAVVFNGEQILEADKLQECDVDVSELIEWKEDGRTVERTRDVIKKVH